MARGCGVKDSMMFIKTGFRVRAAACFSVMNINDDERSNMRKPLHIFLFIINEHLPLM